MLKDSQTGFRKRSQRAFTLMEFLTASTMSVIVIGSLMASSIFVLRSFKAIGNYSDLDRSSRNTLDIMSRDIRNAAGLSMPTYLTNVLIFTNSDGTSFSYQWDPTKTTLTRYYTNGGSVSTMVLLTNCDVLSFYLYQRNPGTNLFFSSTNNPSQTKLINVDWRCSRQVYGSKMNTESIQTAQITVRN